MPQAFFDQSGLPAAAQRLAGVLPPPESSWSHRPAPAVLPVRSPTAPVDAPARTACAVTQVDVSTVADEPPVAGGRARAADDPADGDAALAGEPGARADTPASGLMARLGAATVFDPGRRGVRVLALLVLLVAIGAGVLVWWSRPRPEPVTPALSPTVSAAPSPTAPATLVVAVTGDVHEPGLVELPADARVADAVAAAGGLVPDAETERLNLARPLSDGELVAVGVPPPPGAGDAAAPGAGAGPVDLNTATVTELQVLPGIGPTLAQRIIDHRTTHGSFSSVDELQEVSGIGEARLAELRDRVTV